MDNTNSYTFDIIKSKQFNRKSPYFIILAIIVIASTIIVFLPELFGIERETIPVTIRMIAVLIFIGGMGIFNYESLSRPLKSGTIRFHPEKITIDTGIAPFEIPLNTIRNIRIDYAGYKSLFSNWYGSRNFIHIEDKNRAHKFEIQLHSKEEKTELKNIYNSLKSRGIKITKKGKTVRAF